MAFALWFVWLGHFVWLSSKRPQIIGMGKASLLGIFLGVLLIFLAHKISAIFEAQALKHDIQPAIEAGLYKDCMQLLHDWPTNLDYEISSEDTNYAQLPASIKMLKPVYVGKSIYGDPPNIGICKNGWGGFAIMAATQSGCRVTCLTLSNEQFAYSTELVKKLNLDNLIEIKICDYRDETGLFDHIVSIEMIEAVGAQYWDNYFATLFARLKTGGKAHIQSITIKDEFFESYKKSTDFIQQYIFPGGMVLAPKMIKSRALKNGFIVRDYFEFGLDYAETLRRWKEAFNQKLDSVKAVGFDENFIKIWNFYYSYCEAGFMSRRIDVAQVLLEKK